MKKFFSVLFLVVLFFSFKFPTSAFGESNYDSVYNNLPVLNIAYDNGEDPDEYNDYKNFIKSPYPLIRTSSILICKNIKIMPGYYLLTPKSQNGVDIVLFKQKGKVISVVPVYAKQVINPAVVYKEPPKPKIPLWALPWEGTKAVFRFIFKKQRPPEPPKSALDAEFVDGGKYYQLTLYINENAYKMLFTIGR